jgi:hypothetical protein
MLPRTCQLATALFNTSNQRLVMYGLIHDKYNTSHRSSSIIQPVACEIECERGSKIVTCTDQLERDDNWKAWCRSAVCSIVDEFNIRARLWSLSFRLLCEGNRFSVRDIQIVRQMVCVPSCKYLKINVINVVSTAGVGVFSIFIKATLKLLIVKMRSALFWNFTHRGMVGVYRRFETACLSYLKGLKLGCPETSVRSYHSTMRAHIPVILRKPEIRCQHV